MLLLALLTCALCDTADFSVTAPVEPRSRLCLMHVQVLSYSHGERVLANNAGDSWNQSWPTAFWKIPWCVFFPCNLTLGRDPLIGAASREGLAGFLLGVVPVRWHCPRQGTEDARGGRQSGPPAPGGQASRASPRGSGPAVCVSGEALGSRGARTAYTVRWPLQGAQTQKRWSQDRGGALGSQGSAAAKQKIIILLLT